MLKTPSANPPFFPGSTSLLIFSPSSPEVAKGDGEWGPWSVNHMLSLLLLPLQQEDSSHSAPAPLWGPSHGKQFSMNCSNVGPSHRLQLFTNCPNVGPFPRDAVLQEQAAPVSVPHGVTSPARKPALAWAPLTGLQALPGGCSSASSPWGHSLLQASPCSGVGSLPWAAGGDLLHCGPPWTAGAQPASPWSSLQAAGESLLRCLEYIPFFGHPHFVVW